MYDQHLRIVEKSGVGKIHELLALMGLVQADIADLVPLFELVIVPGDVGDSPAMGVLWQVLDDDVGDLVLVALSFVLALVDEKRRGSRLEPTDRVLGIGGNGWTQYGDCNNKKYPEVSEN
jgi:hypothetical protein